jgi:RES domain-containing protein
VSVQLELFRIVKRDFAGSLLASGRAARWNRSNEEVLYTSSSRALASLELLVHRNAIMTGYAYVVLVIEVTLPQPSVQAVTLGSLPEQWRGIEFYAALQEKGSNWYQSRSALLLEVPAAVIPQEKNFVINTKHPLFAKCVRIKRTEDFFWDARLPLPTPPIS